MRSFFSFIMVIFFTTGIINAQMPRFGAKSTQLNPRGISSETWNGEYSVLLIRVEFQSDTDATTYGNGTFSLRTVSQRIPSRMDYFTVFEQAEVDEEYEYENGSPVHTYSLTDYFKEVSGNRFNLSSYTLTDIVSLPHSMSYYGGNDDSVMNYARLVSDALNAASIYSGASYDFVVILHAGAGEESDAQSQYPNDIASGVITAEEYYEKTGSTLQFGSTMLNTVIILPETETRDTANRGLLGPCAYTFGQAMGMPLMFNADGNSSGLGLWDLMAYGFWNYNGFAPMHPCAYTKILMGWSTIETIDRNGNYDLPVSSSDYSASSWNGNTYFKIPIRESEYFLIEYRERRGIEKFFEIGYSVTELGNSLSGKKVIRENSIPLGVMVYHIREDVISAHPGMPIQGTLKGIDIEEADGFNDLDKPWGQTGSMGDLYDCFGDDPERAFRFTRFNSRTTPSSLDDFSRYTGITFTVHCDTAALEARIAVSNERFDLYPMSYEIAIIPGNYFHSNGHSVVSNDSGETLITYPIDENVISIFDDLIFTTKRIIRYPDVSSALYTFGFDAEKVYKDGQQWYVIGESTIAVFSDAGSFIDSITFSDAEYAVKNGVDWYIRKGSAWYDASNTFRFNGTLLSINKGHVYVLSGVTVTDATTVNHTTVFTVPAGCRDIMVTDFNGDGVSECITAYSDYIGVVTVSGSEILHVPVSNVSFMTLGEDMQGIFLFYVGDTVGKYYLKEHFVREFSITGTIEKVRVTDGELFITTNQEFYGLPGFKAGRYGVQCEDIQVVFTPPQSADVKIYPNPVKNGTLHLSFLSKTIGNGKATIYNARMHIVKTIEFSVAMGENIIECDVHDLKIGTYIALIAVDGINKTIKLSKTE